MPGSSWVGGAHVPATGHTCVRGSPVVGRVVTDKVMPLMPPTLAPLHNPICPWDASFRWKRAFTADSLTMRSNEPQRTAMGLPPPAASFGDSHSLVPAVSQGRLRYVVRPVDEMSAMKTTAGKPFGSFANTMDTPGYFGSTNRLPVLKTPEPSAMSDSPRLTPAHLLRNSYDEMSLQKPYVFQPRRVGSDKIGEGRFANGSSRWQTIAQERDEQVYGEKALL